LNNENCFSMTPREEWLEDLEPGQTVALDTPQGRVGAKITRVDVDKIHLEHLPDCQPGGEFWTWVWRDTGSADHYGFTIHSS
jgi:hypothetical protein